MTDKPGHSLRSAQDAEDEVFTADWGRILWLAGVSARNGNSLTLGHVTIYPGKANARHSHMLCDEALTLLNGNLIHSAGDITLKLHPGDTIFIPAGLFHHAVNSSGENEAEMIVAYSGGERDFVLERERE
jgi:quercetin dioxygenase-like cupin family protein